MPLTKARVVADYALLVVLRVNGAHGQDGKHFPTLCDFLKSLLVRRHGRQARQLTALPGMFSVFGRAAQSRPL
jgi:hypothetical protein